MRLADHIKGTRHYRLNRVLFWLLLTVPIPLIAFCWWAYDRNIQRFWADTNDALAKQYSSDVVMMLRDDFVRQQEAYSRIISVSLLLFILALSMPLLYRLLLFVVHGRASFSQPRGKSSPKSSQRPNAKNASRRSNAEARPDPFVVLGIHRNATFEEIKHAYRSKMREYHPDKVAALGIELRALAERKAKQINEAFEFLSQQHATT